MGTVTTSLPILFCGCCNGSKSLWGHHMGGCQAAQSLLGLSTLNSNFLVLIPQHWKAILQAHWKKKLYYVQCFSPPFSTYFDKIWGWASWPPPEYYGFRWLLKINSIILYKLCPCVRGNFRYKDSPNYVFGFFVYLEIKKWASWLKMRTEILTYIKTFSTGL